MKSWIPAGYKASLSLYETQAAIGPAFKGYQYRMQVSPLDCTGCGNCADVCPLHGKEGKEALIMKPLDSQRCQEANWEFAMEQPEVADRITNKATVKNSQALKPLFEFSGACAGCGETPYVKLVTQLFGDRMIVANATGCSSIYGGSAPTCPYTTDENGHGPAWANSLFEDNAEFGFGMQIGINGQHTAPYIGDTFDHIAESVLGQLFKSQAGNRFLKDPHNHLTSKTTTEAGGRVTFRVFPEVLKSLNAIGVTSVLPPKSL